MRIFFKKIYNIVYYSHSVVSDSLQPHGLYPTSLLCPGDFPGKNTGVGCHFLLQIYSSMHDEKHNVELKNIKPKETILY